MKQKKYRIIGSFTYSGADGKAPQHKSVVLGPGEEVPKLDSDQLDKLLRLGKICEVDLYGENIEYKKANNLSDTQIDNLLGKPYTFIMSYLANLQNSTRPLSSDTLSRMYSLADQKKLPPPLLKQLEGFLGA